MLLVMGHSLRHDTSKEATESLLKVVSAHLPDGTSFPTSKYLFFKHFQNGESKPVKHFYCSSCKDYIGIVDKMLQQVQCNTCSVNLEVKKLQKDSSYFFSLDLAAQIRDLLTSTKISADRSDNVFDVTDITSSLGCIKLPLGPDDITLTFNTDGVPLFNSSGFGIWPILAVVNELPFKERIQRMLLAGLWFGPAKPAMAVFLLPFVNTMNDLSSTGLDWVDQHGKKKTTSFSWALHSRLCSKA